MTRERYIRTTSSIIRQGAVGHHSRRWAAGIAHWGTQPAIGYGLRDEREPAHGCAAV
jgi:hypothetical protein